jgi:hypothetical protein
MSSRTVFVLGAGFTRAFVPSSPLLRDNYSIPDLREQFAAFSTAKRILDEALAEDGDGRIDLERLMTRLSGMPYDSADARRELALVESVLRKTLVQRLKDAKNAGVDQESLGVFARHVLSTGASILTFNYDDVLDEALWRVHEVLGDSPPPEAYWHPDGGYGFFCRPSLATVVDQSIFMDQPRSLLLKLHGSMNWYSRLGDASRLGPAGLLHHEEWIPRQHPDLHSPEYPAWAIEAHLEPEPFIVAPVLVKSELVLHPVLRVLWELAYRTLSSATEVIFIGYSLPATDLGSRFLFQEALSNRSVRLRVVNFGDTKSQREVRSAYNDVFRRLGSIEFDFSGAKEFVTRELIPAATPVGGSDDDSTAGSHSAAP